MIVEMSQAEFASEIGKTRQYVNKLVRDGKIPYDRDRKKIDVAAAKRALKLNADPDKALSRDAREVADDGAGPAPVVRPELSDFNRAKTAREAINARMAKLDLAERMGQLVEKSKVEAEVVRRFSDLRQRLSNLPGRIAAKVARLETERECAVAIDEAIRQLLLEFARGTDPDADDAPDPEESDAD